MTPKLFLLALTLSLFFAQGAQAYTCSDQPYLRQVLLDLERVCGSDIGICEAYSHKGDDVNSAIENCVKAGVHFQNCAQAVNCSPGMGKCETYSYDGSTVNEAIENCVKGNVHFQNCAQAVNCSPGMRVCETYSYDGSTISEAIENCVKAGLHRDNCSQAVKCR